MHVVGDATSRTAGQHARASVVRLRMRTLVTLGVLAVATALLGRAFGLHDVRFLARRARAAGEHVRDLALRAAARRPPRPRRAAPRSTSAALLEALAGGAVARDPRREPRTRQHRPHPDRPAGRVHGRDQEPSRARCASGACTARRSARRRRSATRSSASRRDEGRAAARVQPRVGRPAAGAAQGRARAAGADADRPSARARAESSRASDVEQAQRAPASARCATRRAVERSSLRRIRAARCARRLTPTAVALA